MSSPEMHHGALGREGGEGIVPEGGRGKGGRTNGPCGRGQAAQYR
jgi:hypothetical protein